MSQTDFSVPRDEFERTLRDFDRRNHETHEVFKASPLLQSIRPRGTHGFLEQYRKFLTYLDGSIADFERNLDTSKENQRNESVEFDCTPLIIFELTLTRLFGTFLAKFPPMHNEMNALSSLLTPLRHMAEMFNKRRITGIDIIRNREIENDAEQLFVAKETAAKEIINRNIDTARDTTRALCQYVENDLDVDASEKFRSKEHTVLQKYRDEIIFYRAPISYVELSERYERKYKRKMRVPKTLTVLPPPIRLEPSFPRTFPLMRTPEIRTPLARTLPDPTPRSPRVVRILSKSRPSPRRFPSSQPSSSQPETTTPAANAVTPRGPEPEPDQSQAIPAGLSAPEPAVVPVQSEPANRPDPNEPEPYQSDAIARLSEPVPENQSEAPVPAGLSAPVVPVVDLSDPTEPEPCQSDATARLTEPEQNQSEELNTPLPEPEDPVVPMETSSQTDHPVTPRGPEPEPDQSEAYKSEEALPAELSEPVPPVVPDESVSSDTAPCSTDEQAVDETNESMHSKLTAPEPNATSEEDDDDVELRSSTISEAVASEDSTNPRNISDDKEDEMVPFYSEIDKRSVVNDNVEAIRLDEEQDDVEKSPEVAPEGSLSSDAAETQGEDIQVPEVRCQSPEDVQIPEESVARSEENQPAEDSEVVPISLEGSPDAGSESSIAEDVPETPVASDEPENDQGAELPIPYHMMFEDLSSDSSEDPEDVEDVKIVEPEPMTSVANSEVKAPEEELSTSSDDRIIDDQVQKSEEVEPLRESEDVQEAVADSGVQEESSSSGDSDDWPVQCLNDIDTFPEAEQVRVPVDPTESVDPSSANQWFSTGDPAIFGNPVPEVSEFTPPNREIEEDKSDEPEKSEPVLESEVNIPNEPAAEVPAEIGLLPQKRSASEEEEDVDFQNSPQKRPRLDTPPPPIE